MKKLKLRLAAILTFTIIVTMLPLNSFAGNYYISEDYAYAYDLDGLSFYQEAYDNLVSVTESVYSEHENDIITTYFEKIIDLENEQELKKIDSILNNFKKELENIKNGNSELTQILSTKITGEIGSLLDEFESEIEEQYSLSWNWNVSDKLFAIKQKLGIYAGLIIYSGICSDDTEALLNSAMERFKKSDKILCDTAVSDIKIFVNDIPDRKVKLKTQIQLKLTELLLSASNKLVDKGQNIASLTLYRLTYLSLLQILEMNGLKYAQELFTNDIDTDGDYVNDGVELIYKTNPYKKDTDGDGLDDYTEILLMPYCSPVKYDTDDDGIADSLRDIDGDGLNNLEELEAGTDLLSSDTDGDGLKDGFEIKEFGTDPILFDTDEDGLSDGDEYILGTDPLRVDTDGDGISDNEEIFQQTIIKKIADYSSGSDSAITSVLINVECTGCVERTTAIDDLFNVHVGLTNVPGRIGHPIDIRTVSNIENAIITFYYDENKLGSTDEEELGVLWYDEENQVLELQEGILDTAANTISIETNHFSKYLVVDKEVWFEVWRTELDNGREPGGSGEIQYYDIILTIDSSGSMSWNDPGNLRKEAAKQFVDAFLENDQGAVVDFDSYAYLKVHLTKNKDNIKAAIDTIDSYGGTNIDNAVNLAIDELISGYADPVNKKIIILLTDGEGTYYAGTTQRAVDNDITIYTVGLGSDIDENLLENIASQTGGIFYQAIHSEELVEAFKRIQDDTIGEIDTTDTDGDGIYDIIETTGVINQFGELIITNPYEKDTDGDGIDDNVELGNFIKLPPEPYIAELYKVSSYSFYMIISYPDRVDSDLDGICDGNDTKPLDATPDDDITLFPSNYHSSIMRLKEKHPNWRLVPQNMDINFNVIIQAEMLRGYPCSDIEDCKKIPNILQDGNRFYVATSEAVEYHVDTRNHLSEEHVFQFISSLLEPGTEEDLNTLKAILKETKMVEGAPNAFMEAVEGKKVKDGKVEKQVSALFLAAKSIIETDEGKSLLAKGKIKNYDGYYNMYGIGCKDGPNSWEQGAKRAKEENWVTQEAAIIGGADYIIENYIKKNQDSLYFCKWNIKKIIDNIDIVLDKNKKVDLHQYATNIADACVKGKTLSGLISKAGKLNETYTFRIPVFKNMPVHTKISIKKGSALYEEIVELQQLLKEYGYYDKNIDGKFGDGTEKAVMDFQRDCKEKGYDIEVTGIADEKTWNVLINMR